ncbi:D(1B) dopamine receptor-like [Exaiptasia diaphana]|uniref:G-protein coupled receptors family 1 profile domain-containing protein n=1 Tax=Exaiptasia diaphana TaxID=2652724 RepID=A0A913XQQ0_EXADI|nr:D(1B) dopamine receptor-like [Exaiptasia diaphana]
MSFNVGNSTTSPAILYKGLGWCFSFGLESILITIGNLLTIAAFVKQKCLRKRGTYLLINLAISDIFIGLVPLPIYIYFIGLEFHLWQPYQIGILSLVFYFFDILLGIASLLNLTIIALERLYAAKRPFCYRTTQPSSYYTMIGITWILATVIATLCFCAFYLTSSLMISTYVSMTIVFVAFWTISSSYAIVWMRLRLHSKKNYRKASESERKLGITMIILTILSLAAWLPFVMMNLVIVLSKTQVPSQTIILTTKLLHYGNSLTNCIVYSLRMPDFRRAVIKIVKFDRFDNSAFNSPVDSSTFSPFRSRKMRYSTTINGTNPDVKMELV